MLPRSRMKRCGGLSVGLASIVLGLLLPAGAVAASERVPADYYGVTFGHIWSLPPELRDRHLASMEALGINQIHLPLDWRTIEPDPAAGTDHNYHWGATDAVLGAMARRGIQARIVFAGTPYWAEEPMNLVDRIRCSGAGAIAPAQWAAGRYALALQKIARRYGRGGGFWTDHPALSSQEIETFEVWNEPSAAGGWCPHPSPEIYADYFMEAAGAVRNVDPAADIVVGGMQLTRDDQGPPYHYTIAEFTRRMLARQPGLLQAASAFGVHSYPGLREQQVFDNIAVLRGLLRAGGVPDSEPMAVTEIGWRTYGTPDSVAESDRAVAYRQTTRNLPNTNCNVSDMVTHAWMTPETNTSSGEDFYGIAAPDTATPHPSATAYSDGIALMQGRLAAEPPHQLIRACGSAPAPDRDGDGVPDHDDYYPLDPTRSHGPPGWNSGGSGGGGSDGGGSDGSGGSGSGSGRN